MAELLTTEEAADYLRLSERKLYELVANGEIPCTKVTGRWLFPRETLDRWVLSGLIRPIGLGHANPPPILGGSYDPLLEWARRESSCGLASLYEGSETGLRYLVANKVVTTGIRLHHLDSDDSEANSQVVLRTPGLHDAVVIAFARRQQGLIVAKGNPLGLKDLTSVATSGARVAQRPPKSGSQLLLVALLHRGRVARDGINLAKPIFSTSADVVDAIRAGNVDCGVGTLHLARSAELDFIPLLWERFDLVFRQRDYFRPGPQALAKFLYSAPFHNRAKAMGGYDVSSAGDVRAIAGSVDNGEERFIIPVAERDAEGADLAWIEPKKTCR